MLTDNLQIKSIEDEQGIEDSVAFLSRVLSHRMDRRIWDWEFASFPDETVSTMVWKGGETVGTQFMVPFRLRAGSRGFLSGKCENSYFDDRFRGMGLFERLFSFASEISVRKSIELLWAFTPASKVYEKKLGFTVFQGSIHGFSLQVGKPRIGFIRQFSKNDLVAYSKYAYGLLRYLAFNARLSLFSMTRRRAASISDYEVRDSLASFDDMDMLYESLRRLNDDFVHVRFDEAFFDWRVRKNVNLPYLTKFFYRNGELKGYYILALNDGSANLSDFTSLSAEDSNVMVVHLMGEVVRMGMEHLNYMGNVENGLNIRNFELLKRFGGRVDAIEGMPFVFKRISDKCPDMTFLKSPGNWYLNGIWTEGFTY
jgi:hypothetical protein